METTKQRARVNMRPIICRDKTEVLIIEKASQQYPWDWEFFFNCMRQKNCLCMVAERWEDEREKIVGFMIYRLLKSELHLLNLAVHPDHRRKGVGSQMVKGMIEKLRIGKYKKIIVKLRETNLDAQLFFRAMGFRAIAVSREFYPDSGEDAYIMVYSALWKY